jgi:hypothetical protein
MCARVYDENPDAEGHAVSRRLLLASGAGLAAASVIGSASAQESTPAAAESVLYPPSAFGVHVVGLHCAKDDPHTQMEAHHFCQPLPDGTIQCALFDGAEVGAKLIGVEYIVSGDVFDTFPEEEHQYWHPHNYEILSGTLVGPEMTEADDLGLMTMLMNSYGKTWHTWHTGGHGSGAMAGNSLPVGPAQLQWSFNRDGEANPDLVAASAEENGFDLAEKRESRQSLVDVAEPQVGVDDLKDAFPEAMPEPPTGVEDAG